MSDIRLFRLSNGKASEMQGIAADLEKPLQTLIEQNLEPLLGVRFIATEYSTGKTHAGRIDTLGLDENRCPVILEYKRSTGENVINQGLFYLDWLMDHKAEFKLAVMDRFGKGIADEIDWSAPKLICIAADFTKYDGHAVQQMTRNIELIRYRRFGTDLLLLELVNAVSSRVASKQAIKEVVSPQKETVPGGRDKTLIEWFSDLPKPIRDLFDSLEGFTLSLGDDVQRKDLKLYVAFTRIKNFATLHFQKNKIVLYVHVEPSKDNLLEGFTKDVSKINHWGTGDLKIVLRNQADLERAKPLIRQAYEGSK